MLYETAAEYDAEIAIARSSLKRSHLVALHSKNVSGGSERAMTEVDVKETKEYITLLIQEKKMLTSTSGAIQMGAGW